MNTPRLSIKDTLIGLFRPRLPANLLGAAALAVLATTLYFQNKFGVFPVKRLAIVALLTLPAFVGVSLLFNTKVFRPAKRRTALLTGRVALLAGLAAFALLLWLFPLPTPDFRQNHSLVISASGERRDVATDSFVEIRELKYLNGEAIPPEAISFTPDWQWSGDVLYSRGAPESRLEIQGEMPAGLRVNLRYSAEGGIARITWDGVAQEYDLYSRDGTVIPTAFRGLAVFGLPFGQALVTLGVWLLYCLGIIALLAGGLLVLLRFTGGRFEKAVYLLALAGLALVFLYFKAQYLRIDAPRVFRDSLSYVITAQEPLFSSSFLAGTRSFSLPLFLKLVGTTLENYNSPAQLAKIALAQTVLSAVSWGALALALLKTARSRWFGVVLFGGVLAFGLSLEISLWDALLLSESLSFSLFALLLAAWIWLLTGLPNVRQRWTAWSGILLTFLISLLYTFVRDSNIYFILMGAGLLALAWLTDRRMAAARGLGWLFCGSMVLLFVFQNVSMNNGNRWQIFMYDHLAMRFLTDSEATRFFVNEGLPMSDLLMQTPSMSGVEYQRTFIESPEMQPVRDWVDRSSKGAYIRYLLSDPLRSLREPLDNAGKLLNGSSLEYRSPAYGVQPAPEKLVQIDALFFNHQPWLLALFGIAALAGIGAYLYRRENPAWVVIAGLVLSLYPLMFLVWHAEPLEIERHAANIILQFRLAGWLALAYWAEWAARRLV